MFRYAILFLLTCICSADYPLAVLSITPCYSIRHQHQLTADAATTLLCFTEADEANMLPFADEAEQSDSDQTWHSLLWIPPSDVEPAERDMLHLDDELAGLVEAADTPAGQDGTHSTKPEPAVSVPGELLIVHSKSATAGLTSQFAGCEMRLLACSYRSLVLMLIVHEHQLMRDNECDGACSSVMPCAALCGNTL